MISVACLTERTREEVFFQDPSRHSVCRHLDEGTQVRRIGVGRPSDEDHVERGMWKLGGMKKTKKMKDGQEGERE